MQDIAAILIVVIAAGYLARLGWLRFSRKAGGSCGSCSSCPSNNSITVRPLVHISLDASRK